LLVTTAGGANRRPFSIGGFGAGIPSPLPFLETAMSDLNALFEQARADSKNLPEKPSNMDLLRLYALYKQGSVGDVEGDRPGMTDFVERAKWDAWAALKGQSKEASMQGYVDLIESLK
jgi:diazepam-binding inhibitor (GABA receptor modulating acyl-CoA-binding protein)